MITFSSVTLLRFDKSWKPTVWQPLEQPGPDDGAAVVVVGAAVVVVDVVVVDVVVVDVVVEEVVDVVVGRSCKRVGSSVTGAVRSNGA